VAVLQLVDLSSLKFNGNASANSVVTADRPSGKPLE
jgi:hypothetical protein